MPHNHHYLTYRESASDQPATIPCALFPWMKNTNKQVLFTNKIFGYPSPPPVSFFQPRPLHSTLSKIEPDKNLTTNSPCLRQVQRGSPLQTLATLGVVGAQTLWCAFRIIFRNAQGVYTDWPFAGESSTSIGELGLNFKRGCVEPDRVS